MSVVIPEDFEVLQIYSQKHYSDKLDNIYFLERNIFQPFEYENQLNFLSDCLTLVQCLSLRKMIKIIFRLAELSLGNINEENKTKEFPFENKADFLCFVMTLPKERISSFIENSLSELMKKRIYYVVPSGEKTFKHEGFGYIEYCLDKFLEKENNNSDIENMNVEEMKEYLSLYENVLVEIFPPMNDKLTSIST